MGTVFLNKRWIVCVLCGLAMMLQSVCSVHADYLDDYLKPAYYQIKMEKDSGKEDRNRYAAYLRVVENCIEQYGETDTLEGPSSGMHHFTGLSFLKLVDFNKDGAEELFLAFYVRKNDESDWYEDYIYIYNIWGYDGREAVLLQDGNYLYGFNGGQQTVFFIDQPERVLFLHGAADSFTYNYYYGYEGKEFGLLKTIRGDNYPPIWKIDGESVSEEQAEKELQEWGKTSDAQESYSITPFERDQDGVRELIDETIRFLRDHSRELPEEKEEKGEEKTEENVPDQEQEKEKEEKPIRRLPFGV